MTERREGEALTYPVPVKKRLPLREGIGAGKEEQVNMCGPVT